MAKKVEIVLKKDGAEDIIVECPQKVKLSVMGALFVIRFGLPPADVKPVQGKDVIKCLGLFLSIFLAGALVVVSQALGVIAFIGTYVLNVIYNKNYFFNFIKKKIEEGYSVEDEEQRRLLEEAGIHFSSASNFSSSSESSSRVQKDITAELEKLASLKEKGILSDDEFAAQKAKLLGL